MRVNIEEIVSFFYSCSTQYVNKAFIFIYLSADLNIFIKTKLFSKLFETEVVLIIIDSTHISDSNFSINIYVNYSFIYFFINMSINCVFSPIL